MKTIVKLENESITFSAWIEYLNFSLIEKYYYHLDNKNIIKIITNKADKKLFEAKRWWRNQTIK